MKTTVQSLIMLALIAGTCPGPLYSLEQLSSAQMKQSTAEAGVDIALNSVVTEIYSDGLKFTNTDDENQYLYLKGLHSRCSLDTGKTDMDGDGKINHLSIDMGTFNNNVFMVLKSPDL
jgi:hypothetical protein